MEAIVPDVPSLLVCKVLLPQWVPKVATLVPLTSRACLLERPYKLPGLITRAHNKYHMADTTTNADHSNPSQRPPLVGISYYIEQYWGLCVSVAWPGGRLVGSQAWPK